MPRRPLAWEGSVQREQTLLNGPRQAPGFRRRHLEVEFEIAAKMRDLTVVQAIRDFLDTCGALQSDKGGFQALPL